MSDDFECANCEEEFSVEDRRDWHPPESADPAEVMHLCPECHGYARGYADRAAEPQPAPEGRTGDLKSARKALNDRIFDGAWAPGGMETEAVLSDYVEAASRPEQAVVEVPRDLLEGAIQAFRTTREYVGEGLLPEQQGWAWFDATTALRAALARSTPAPSDGGEA